MQLQNGDGLKVMFGNITSDEKDHWNSISSNPVIPINVDNTNLDVAEQHMVDNNDLEGDEVEEVTHVIDNAIGE